VAGSKRLRLRSAGAAATFVLAAVASVLGGEITNGALVGVISFIGVVIVGGCATYLVDRAAGEKDERGTLDCKSNEAWYADLRGAEGVQLGDGNDQNNFFGGNPQ
jgi:hypothetical protein